MSQAAEKVLVVLEHVAARREAVSAMSVASRLGLDKSTCSRLLALLVQHGWLVRDDRTRLFGIGPTLAKLGATAVVSNGLQSILLPLLTKLRDETGETVSFHRRIGDSRVCVAGLESQEVIRRVLPIGESFRLPIGPSGKAILAFVDPAHRDALLGELDAATAALLRRELDSVVRTGFISTDGDHIAGVGAISVPVFDVDGVFGSLTVAGPMQRWHPDRREAALPELLSAGQALSDTLGAARARYHQWRRGYAQSRQGATI
ncbi:IclR family transcriptional regulator [Saccharomonospora sp. NPDC046836]|uniref:IclR family transcriptional regulator n=1 Tax=Saccharomonospora sp. NPDC046836 TaxID=3156921 RepID=UPI0034044C52